MGENLKPVWADFSTISLAVTMMCIVTKRKREREKERKREREKERKRERDKERKREREKERKREREKDRKTVRAKAHICRCTPTSIHGQT